MPENGSTNDASRDDLGIEGVPDEVGLAAVLCDRLREYLEGAQAAVIPPGSLEPGLSVEPWITSKSDYDYQKGYTVTGEVKFVISKKPKGE
jgi:hypothetical protein